MNIEICNLGSIRYANFSLGKMTIICGKNNTGKTYATYALYGYLKTWRNHLPISIDDESIDQLFEDGFAKINLCDYISIIEKTIEDSCISYDKNIPQIFSSREENFKDTRFRLKIPEEINKNVLHSKSQKESSIGSSQRTQFKITKKEDSDFIEVSLLTDKKNIKIPRDIIKHEIEKSIKESIFETVFPNPFIASAERTGAAIFRSELDFARSKLLKKLQSEDEFNPIEILFNSENKTDYPLPVEDNVDFIRSLEKYSKFTSFIAKNHNDITKDFSDIIGGEYTIKDGQLYYIPKENKGVRLHMDESSSSVRSLLDIGFYINHLAKKNDILIVDEPELNLHPENQIRMARLFARLINIGIKVFITTHSDYIIKELNTLIMLNGEKQHLKKIIEQEKYKKEELINENDIKVYIAKKAKILLPWNKRKTECQTLVKASIDKNYGIDAPSFDSTIDRVNKIQEAIIWGE